MRRIALILSVVAAGVAALAVPASSDDEHTYLIEMYNAFGIVEGSDVRVAGVNAGTVTALDVNSAKRAVVEVSLSGPLSVLGEESTCETEPQSLIAEYFIDCTPDGPEIEPSGDPEDPDIPASQVSQTVQPDLVQNTLREPYKRRLQLLINEFGTALAGNPENLNEAIRLGAPALTQLRKVLDVMGDQNRIIRDLNVDSDRIIARLTQRREDVVAFIQEARDTAAASAERREDLSQDFALLDDFLVELQPTLADLENLARVQTPVLTDLRASAPGLNQLVLNLPSFNSATEDSLESLGEASQVGTRALRQGREEIDQLADSGRNATASGEFLADFVRDVDDPARAVEEDTRAAEDTGDPDRAGYTGLEGLLNYGYYQAGAVNQFDQVGHLLHFSLYYIFSGECGRFTTGRDFVTSNGTPAGPGNEIDGTPGLPAEGGGFTTAFEEIEDCIGWLGPNQPGLNQDLDLGPYDPSVCPGGTEPAEALALCNPAGQRSPQRRASGDGGGTGSQGATASGAPGSGAPGLPGLPNLPGGQLPDGVDIDDLLDLPPGVIDNLPPRLQDRIRDLRNQLGGGGGGSGGGGPLGNLGGAGGGGGGGGGSGGGGGGGVNDVLDFILGP